MKNEVPNYISYDANQKGITYDTAREVQVNNEARCNDQMGDKDQELVHRSNEDDIMGVE